MQVQEEKAVQLLSAKVCILILHWCHKDKILVTAPKLQEDWLGIKPGATRCHGTRIARGIPLPVYINLDLYSGFWCTSHCVVFKYSVPPLTDQALRKVLLTS